MFQEDTFNPLTRRQKKIQTKTRKTAVSWHKQEGIEDAMPFIISLQL